MKKMSVKQLALLVGIDLLIVLNLLIFIITSMNKKEAFQSAAWWLSYALAMLPIIIIVVAMLVTRKNERLQSPFLPLLFPVSVFILIVAVVFLFFGPSLPVLIPILFLVVFSGFVALGFIFGAFYQSRTKNEEIKEVKVIDMDGLIKYLDNLALNENENIQKTAQKLSDLAQSPSNKDEEELNKLEKRIFEITYFMDRDIKEGKTNNLFFHAEQMEKLLKERLN